MWIANFHRRSKSKILIVLQYLSGILIWRKCKLKISIVDVCWRSKFQLCDINWMCRTENLQFLHLSICFYLIFISTVMWNNSGVYLDVNEKICCLCIVLSLLILLFVSSFRIFVEDINWKYRTENLISLLIFYN